MRTKFGANAICQNGKIKKTPARGHNTRAKEKDMNAKELAKKHNVSHTIIYNMAKKLGRLPTDEEVENRNRKTGRPQKYRSIEDEDGK